MIFNRAKLVIDRVGRMRFGGKLFVVAILISACFPIYSLGDHYWHHIDHKRLVLKKVKAQILGRNQSCPVHHQALKLDIIRVRYGLTYFFENDQTLYPFSNRTQNRGCMGPPGMYTVVFYCSLCRIAKQQDIDQIISSN